MRWNTRSAPERSTRTAMPGYFASNALPTFSESGRSTDVYQTTLPSFLAASTSAGVTGSAAGACARKGEANTVAASAVVPCRSLRRDNLGIFVSLGLCCRAPAQFNLLAHGNAAVADAARPSRLAERSAQRT